MELCIMICAALVMSRMDSTRIDGLTTSFQVARVMDDRNHWNDVSRVLESIHVIAARPTANIERMMRTCLFFPPRAHYSNMTFRKNQRARGVNEMIPEAEHKANTFVYYLAFYLALV